MERTSILYFLLLLHFCCYPITSIGYTSNTATINLFSPQNSVTYADQQYLEQNYSNALEAYKTALQDPSVEPTYVYKKLALCEAQLGNAIPAAEYAESYLVNDYKPTFLFDEGFAEIQNTTEFQEVVNLYTSRMTIWSFGYLYVALIGFYIAIIINFNRKIDKIARFLISAFVFIHSIFILHIFLSVTNYQFQFPHSYRMSICFSFLYGPLLYFYFKRITKQYEFRKADLLHLLPTVLMLIYMIPYYMLSGSEKLEIMLNRAGDDSNSANLTLLVVVVGLKLASLMIYGYFIRKLYIESKRNKDLRTNNKKWQRNIYIIHFSYIITYAIYGALIIYDLDSGFFYHLQVVCMSLLVVFVGYSANVQPNLFSGLYSFDNQLLFKYKKSGLTRSLSQELKEQLIRLFDEEKIYKDNDINLEVIASKLNTTRHNASQVINEHFQVSFHELINTYRIQEAKKILDDDKKNNLNIIDIAYEVGYNNKVTFNKAFKKDTRLTPSQYQKVFVKS
ncbi:helix-turn-helix domain-containing protein [Muriicola sp. Z0-33]|uniref:helix-turn-helix domain-containing protein n=1 Tax=Muriicola sp. Z0-33 TaxID=2816957 RepID=UPI0022390848|nr:helix-turn-helix domain-containing protein [Muriicola sp. Z0-33]MCW5517593.1 helix-turn-helix transcriptional regulator [Muriicola sp. Z0-33]